ncbi:hypothetical protein SAMN05444166_0155 [Singulisphaera sp. GP187]|uniref:hypothetical protein n=1 Tax=Singulisphaera sp. GP187 TaxID=1882752 RepID=UPI000925E54C|nr:hypothetical protein [Singulisphaera sp. GP187]SIN69184.1 hypothetical protein SAMN05444166_0155 [Singulisphaera sp. GP187]
MATHGQVLATIDRSVTAIRRYHDAPRTQQSILLMVAEVQMVAGWVHELMLAANEVDELIVHPVRGYLIERYGHELGVRLAGEFLRAFDGLLAEEQGTLVYERLNGLA